MEELSIYNLTITSDHKLKVNNEEVTGDGSILPGDSEGLLTWALMQVGYIQQDNDSPMSLHIDDQRPNGYGTQRVVIPAGRQVLIEDLRRRTGRDLSHITREIESAHYAEENPEAEAPADDAGYTHESSGGSPFTEGDDEGGSTAAGWDEGSVTAADTPPEAEAEDPAPAPAPESDPEPTPEPERASEPDTAPDTAPQAPEDTPAFEPDTAEDFAPDPTPEATPELEEPLPGEDTTPEDDTTQPADDSEHLPLLSEFGSQGNDETVIAQEDIKVKRKPYKRKRPKRSEEQVKKDKVKKKRSMPKSRTLLIALAVVSILAILLLFLLIGAKEKSSYVATCVDERTMTRQASDEACKSEAAPYYRWWYTPRGSEVPAVNQNIAQDQGTRIRPEEATIHEGFAPEGGPYDE